MLAGRGHHQRGEGQPAALGRAAGQQDAERQREDGDRAARGDHAERAERADDRHDQRDQQQRAGQGAGLALARLRLAAGHRPVSLMMRTVTAMLVCY